MYNIIEITFDNIVLNLNIYVDLENYHDNIPIIHKFLLQNSEYQMYIRFYKLNKIKKILYG
jgi:hypothetical protein